MATEIERKKSRREEEWLSAIQPSIKSQMKNAMIFCPMIFISYNHWIHEKISNTTNFFFFFSFFGRGKDDLKLGIGHVLFWHKRCICLAILFVIMLADLLECETYNIMNIAC